MNHESLKPPTSTPNRAGMQAGKDATSVVTDCWPGHHHRVRALSILHIAPYHTGAYLVPSWGNPPVMTHQGAQVVSDYSPNMLLFGSL